MKDKNYYSAYDNKLFPGSASTFVTCMINNLKGLNKMSESEQLEYDRISKLPISSIEFLKSKWLLRLYANKYESDKLYINFDNNELRALIKLLKGE